ncbi:MAG: hypothetical protein BRC44_12270 [Cyanobacteria bacterium QS_4_48_99]|nr:MAG: hypothetical protein BRC44_12270 [Cyanobacteria bacterium QS_4_48_99]PSO84934.1 MAG: hypothetical protein BRC45_04715 [Cyanobacteria bacterium QS_5_48_63]PSO85907.1 MAG: hypothetical protein BRC43_12910 [Cyanobacteria bacterium QS_3_48_167]PSO89230.1 MAG: hypothetical protein BRC46_16410 [Cyanobacteria bacterium QS_6_48_18]PSO97211.1 MAG: hypothetical protein BRC48_04645 [Cyanobacteria bacterium QS_9_48_30]PSP35893.1 MAG: hypothetical protein BRC57_04525 [Cyanobacteria bacterium QS_8_4
MTYPEPRIPAESAPEVFALASRLYAQQKGTYSLSELIEAGAEAKIPPEYIQQAVQQIQTQQNQTRKRSETLKGVAISAGVAVTLLGLLTFLGESMASGCHSTMSMTGSQTTQSR